MQEEERDRKLRSDLQNLLPRLETALSLSSSPETSQNIPGDLFRLSQLVGDLQEAVSKNMTLNLHAVLKGC